jgi:hypothetical protein
MHKKKQIIAEINFRGINDRDAHFAHFAHIERVSNFWDSRKYFWLILDKVWTPC